MRRVMAAGAVLTLLLAVFCGETRYFEITSARPFALYVNILMPAGSFADHYAQFEALFSLACYGLSIIRCFRVCLDIVCILQYAFSYFSLTKETKPARIHSY
jgi:hypothetical protein